MKCFHLFLNVCFLNICQYLIYLLWMYYYCCHLAATSIKDELQFIQMHVTQDQVGLRHLANRCLQVHSQTALQTLTHNLFNSEFNSLTKRLPCVHSISLCCLFSVIETLHSSDGSVANDPVQRAGSFKWTRGAGSRPRAVFFFKICLPSQNDMTVSALWVLRAC